MVSQFKKIIAIVFGFCLTTLLCTWRKLHIFSVDPVDGSRRFKSALTESPSLSPSTRHSVVEDLPKSNKTPLIDNSTGERTVDSKEFVPLDPEFTLHQKKGSWGWHHLTGEEAAQELLANQNVCKKPFKHCCLGQGRQQSSKMDGLEALWKLKNTDDESLQLGTFGDVLKHYPVGLSKESMCTFAFWGDSLSSDSAMGAVCEALRLGYKLKSCSTSGMDGGQLYGDDSHYSCEENRYNGTEAAHFLLENDESSSCPSVLIVFWFDLSNGITSFPASIVELGGILVFNRGVHCNSDDGCLEAQLSPLLSDAADDAYQHWRFMFRETEPQHFATQGGLFLQGKMQPHHHICSDFRGRINTWRNIKVIKMIEDRGLTEKVNILPISSALESLTNLHYGTDCTHYCYDPHRLDVTWDALLTALQG